MSGAHLLTSPTPRIPISRTRSRSRRALFDFIQSIGEAQRVTGQVPAEIKDLRAALRAHVGLLS